MCFPYKCQIIVQIQEEEAHNNYFLIYYNDLLIGYGCVLEDCRANLYNSLALYLYLKEPVLQ